MAAIKPDVLKQHAQKAATFSHSPFSKYPVGAALLTEDGTIFEGCNIESSSYGLTVCAERNAIAAAVVKGHTKFKALAVYSVNGATPCGACRQVIWDICGNIPIYIFSENNYSKMYFSGDLLPAPFDNTKLEKENSE
ncbi:MAG TPA: cytidine deaminase [Candidatus Marinimicrobia bacterium]|nr:cytidine deaminase [Candidatus Neomarinimicrobiota bacterium]